eukprot:4802663-Pleurochrysis_carterae.AAC.1
MSVADRANAKRQLDVRVGHFCFASPVSKTGQRGVECGWARRGGEGWVENDESARVECGDDVREKRCLRPRGSRFGNGARE